MHVEKTIILAKKLHTLKTKILKFKQNKREKSRFSEIKNNFLNVFATRNIVLPWRMKHESFHCIHLASPVKSHADNYQCVVES